MIVAMKKIFLLVQQAQAAKALDSLAALGVLHVEHQIPPAGQEINETVEKVNAVEHAILILSKISSDNKSDIPQKSTDAMVASHHVIDLEKRRLQLMEYSVTLKSWIDQWQGWGDFEPEKIRQLSGDNVFLKLYQIPKEHLKELPKGVFLKKIFAEGQIFNCVVFSRTNITLPFKEIDLPKMSLSQMKARLDEDSIIIRDLEKQLLNHVCSRQSLSEERKKLISQKEFYEVLKGMGRAEEIMYVKGYVPVDSEAFLIKEAKNNGWGIFTSDPKEDDPVPTFVRNPRWIALIKPLLKLLELVPGYNEIDISPLFMVFFSLFFGILIGDAGYGLVYFLLNLWLFKKIGHKVKDKSAFFLFYILSFCAIIWGLLTATFFGQEWLLNMGIKPLIPALGNAAFIQALCFFIGALHLSIAHGWRAALKAPSLDALAEVGWMSVIWAVFFLAKSLILGDAFPGFGKWLIIAGLFLVLFFTNPQKNILKTIGSGLGTIALSLVNNFTDVVSYIRLFAVGLAGVAIADAFNGMAAGVFKKGDFFTLIAAALILILGHALNIILGPMSVLVHGVRLNVLEFCSHASVTWSGFAYKPFSKK